MAEPLPSSTEANSAAISRLRALTYASLFLNAVILLVIVVGAIAHHHRQERDFDRRDDDRGRGDEHRGPDRDDRPFHRFADRQRDGRGGREDRFNEGRDDRRFDRGGWRQRDDSGPGPRGPRPDMGAMNNGMPGMMAAPDPVKMSENVMTFLTNRLTLTDDQKNKIRPIIDQQVADLQKQHAAMQKQIEDTRAKLKPLLTPDQQKQLDAISIPGAKPAPAGK